MGRRLHPSELNKRSPPFPFLSQNGIPDFHEYVLGSEIQEVPPVGIHWHRQTETLELLVNINPSVFWLIRKKMEPFSNPQKKVATYPQSRPTEYRNEAGHRKATSEEIFSHIRFVDGSVSKGFFFRFLIHKLYSNASCHRRCLSHKYTMPKFLYKHTR